jgi:shikimate kinase
VPQPEDAIPPPDGQQPAITIVALTGFMGAGKSTIGRTLAGLLGCEFLDLDDEIERACGQRIRDIFRVHGEVRFREIETATLRKLLEGVSAVGVIALGGGTFIQPLNVELLKTSGVRVVSLEAPIQEMFQRCQAGMPADDNSRPLASDFDAFRALYEERVPQYRTAELIVNTSGRSSEEVAREIVSVLRLAASGS